MPLVRIVTRNKTQAGTVRRAVAKTQQEWHEDSYINNGEPVTLFACLYCPLISAKWLKAELDNGTSTTVNIGGGPIPDMVKQETPVTEPETEPETEEVE